jgi:hypothetical protein
MFTKEQKIEKLKKELTTKNEVVKKDDELDKLYSDLLETIRLKINGICYPYTTNEKYLQKYKKFLLSNSLEEILSAIDLAADKYLLYKDGQITIESAEDFCKKVFGVLVMQSRPEIDKKISYICGICRNRFNYWDQKIGKIKIKNYVNEMRKLNFNEELILNYLDKIIDKTKVCKHWSGFREIIENYNF